MTSLVTFIAKALFNKYAPRTGLHTFNSNIWNIPTCWKTGKFYYSYIEKQIVADIFQNKHKKQFLFIAFAKNIMPILYLFIRIFIAFAKTLCQFYIYLLE